MNARLHRILIALFFLGSLPGQQPAQAQQSGFGLQTGDAEAEEPVRRYSIEFILFTYGESVSAGTEIFVPENVPEPPIADPLTELTGAGYPPGPLTDPGSLARSDGSFRTDDEDEIPQYGDMVLMPGAGNLGEEELEPILNTRSVNLRVLTHDELTLTDVHEKLLRLDAYRPVLWTGWVQDVREEAQTPTIQLRRLGDLPLQFSGNVKLYLGRFLHLVTDVQMQAPAAVSPQRSYRASPPSAFGQNYGYAPDGYGREAPVYYAINDDRIMKSGDLRYFDHPKFGILAMLTRVEDAVDPLGAAEDLAGEQLAPGVATPATGSTPRP